MICPDITCSYGIWFGGECDTATVNVTLLNDNGDDDDDDDDDDEEEEEEEEEADFEDVWLCPRKKNIWNSEASG